MRVVAFAFLTPFFFIKGGLNVSLGAVFANLGLLAALLTAKMLPKIAFIFPLACREQAAHLAAVRGVSSRPGRAEKPAHSSNLYRFQDLDYSSLVPASSQSVHVVKANLFRVLGHPARVRILELLRDEERSVGALQKELGLDSGGTSQHLAALRRIGLVESRREGTSVYYRVDDERVFDLLEAGRGIITRQLAEQQSILNELEGS